jgi:hypothetical protein
MGLYNIFTKIAALVALAADRVVLASEQDS